MKPVFYKKLIPLAMIASMAVSNLSVAAEAAVVKPAASGDAAVEEIEVPDIAGEVIQVNAAGEDENEETNPSISIIGDKSKTLTFLTSEAGTAAKELTLEFNVTAAEKFQSFSIVTAKDSDTLAAGITVKGEPALAGDKVTATVIVEKSVSNASIYLKGVTKATEADEEAGTEAKDAETIYSGAYEYKKGADEKVATVITATEKSQTIKYDKFDPDSVSREVTLTFNIKKDAKTSVKAANLKLLKVVNGENDTTTNAALDSSIKKPTFKIENVGDGKAEVNVTVTTSIPKSLLASESGMQFVLDFSGTASDAVTVNADVTGYVEKNGTKVTGKKLEKYTGDATEITIDTGDITEICAGAFEKKKIKTFKVTGGGTLTVAKGAFKNCSDLVLIDLAGINTGSESSFDKDAIDSCAKAFVKINKTSTSDEKVAKELQEISNPVIWASDKLNSSSESVYAGEEIKANLLENVVIYNGDKYAMNIAKDAENAAVTATPEQLANAKWAIYTLGADGKIAVNSKGKSVTSSAAKFISSSNKGEVALLSGLKSAGAFNNAVRLVAQIPEVKDGKTEYVDYANFDFYVNPQQPTKFKDVKPVAGKFVVGIEADTADYVLTVAENATYKIPLALADGQNKALDYVASYETDSAGSFTVTNGTVKGLKASDNAGTIEVKAQDGTAKATVKVVVTSAVKGLKASTASLSMAKGLTQSFTIAPTTSAGAFDVTVDFDEATYELKYGDVEVKKGDEVNIDGAQEFTIKFKNAPEKKDFKGAMKSITFAVKNDAKKKAVVKLAYATAPTDAKSIKQAVKKAKNADTVKVAVPVGGIYNLGVAVNPATAKNEINWEVKKADGTWEAIGATNTPGIEIKGGVIVANDVTASPVMVKAVVSGANNSTTLESDVFEISTYKAASSITWAEGADYVLRGGYLVKKNTVDTTCDKELNAGETITFNAPTGGGTEKIIWTANKPGSVFISENSGMLTIKPLAAGTYTITGVTEYTKQKISFKVSVGKDETKPETADSLMWKKANTADAWQSGDILSAKIGDQFQFALNSDYTNTAPTFAAAPAGNVTINKTTGLVTIKKAGDVVISVGEKNVTIKVATTAADVKLTVASYAQTGKEFNATVKGISNAKWYAVKADGAVIALAAGSKNKIKFPEASAAEGKYKVYAYAGSNENPGVADLGDVYAELNVYDVVATKATALDPWEWVDSEGGIATKSFGSLKDMANAKLGIEQGYGFVLPVTATGQGTNKMTVKASGNPDEIVWTSSNSNLAWVEGTATNDTSNPNIYGKYTVMTSKDYTGKVTLTGTLKNSGKKVKVTLNVVAAPSTPATNE